MTAAVETKPLCGFCSHPAGRGAPHPHCPGAIDSGKSLWVCSCGCQALRCITCKSSENVDPSTWHCRDKGDCDAEVARRVAADPRLRFIREITERAEARVAAERAERPARAATAAGAFRPGSGKCECGCGADTKSRFAMGHDARLRSVLAKAYAAGDEAAGRELAARGGVWADKAPGAALPGDPDAYVTSRVKERLS